MAKVIDTNLIIRFLLNDNPRQAASVKSLFSSQEKLHLPELIVAEVVWVLQSVYKFPKSAIIEKLQQLIGLNIFICNKKLLNRSLALYKEYPVSYIDAYLTAFSIESRLEGLYSFDKGLDKVKGIKRFEP